MTLGVPIPNALSKLRREDIDSAPAPESVLVYNDATGKWEDRTRVAAGVNSLKQESFVLSAGDISNKYVLLVNEPIDPLVVRAAPVGGGEQLVNVDYVMDGTNKKKLRWDGLGFESILNAGDTIVVLYTV